MSLINFLNANQGAVMAILTFVYVVATVVIVVFTKGSIEEMKKARIEDNRPYIFAYFAFVPRETKHCYLVLKNYGRSGGKITNLAIRPSVNLLKGSSDCSFFKDTVMAPGQSIKLLVADTEKAMIDESYSISISYEDMSQSHVYRDCYSLIQQYVGEYGFVDTKRSGCGAGENALINISNSLDTIKTSFL